MNINSLFGSVASNPTSNVNAVSTSATTSTSSIPPSAAANAAISTPGQFLSQMQALSQSNPAEFKSVAAQVATTCQNAASQSTGPASQFLSGLANQFSQAAQTGTLALPSTQGGPATQGISGAQGAQATQSGSPAVHHHHHHHGGGGGMQSSEVAQAFGSAMDVLTSATSATSSSTTSTAPAATTTV
jgi:hypothetical protein